MAVITPRPLLGVGFVRIRGCFESAIRRSRGVQRGVQGEFILGCSVGAELRNLGCSTLSHFNLTHTTKTTSSSKSFLPRPDVRINCFVWRVACSGADKVS
jgi:hypothetical protein